MVRRVFVILSIGIRVRVLPCSMVQMDGHALWIVVWCVWICFCIHAFMRSCVHADALEATVSSVPYYPPECIIFVRRDECMMHSI